MRNDRTTFIALMGIRVLEQHIAVFGERGSGKTVLLSSFYGLMREKQTQC